ncbi:unnamed protein product [Kuraishia capsulata CBS 1993]|uniref:C2H2-type domain-containing protein n=1 Tax=Kuraishia capsulata CBS 1993 TaxID=1382522 RepID=W6MRW0_9ASCO|nr:uncharacterized protein KUCA_T00005100001 [Kuraishia capsulata CBS 1993]CDK29113.1 unnamed protein product [Kuraishia capsulata CBS 1993]
MEQKQNSTPADSQDLYSYLDMSTPGSTSQETSTPPAVGAASQYDKELLSVLEDPFNGSNVSQFYGFSGPNGAFAGPDPESPSQLSTSVQVSLREFNQDNGAQQMSNFDNPGFLSVNLSTEFSGGYDELSRDTATGFVPSASYLDPNLYEGDQFKITRNISNTNLSEASSTSPYLAPSRGSSYDVNEILSPMMAPFADDEDSAYVSSTLGTLRLENEFSLSGNSPSNIQIETPPPTITINGDDTVGLESKRPASLFSSAHNTPSASPKLAAQPLPLQQQVDNAETSYLSPEDTHTQMRLGRQRLKVESSGSRSNSRSNSRSTSRSRSRSRDSERSDSYYTSGDDDFEEESGDDTDADHNKRMAELASPNSKNKRAQKNPSVFPCDQCDKRFTRPYNLKSHKRTHTNERPYICKICGKPFARQHDRKRHEDLHSGEKRYQCRGELENGSIWGCGRKFARTDALRRHFQTESGKQCIAPVIQEVEKGSATSIYRPQNSTNGVTADSSQFDMSLTDSALLDKLISNQELNFK